MQQKVTLFKKIIYDKLIKKFNAMQNLDTINLVKKLTMKQMLGKLEMKILHHDHSRYITIEELNKLTANNFAGRLV